MTVHIHTICYNEIDIMPFVIKYWKHCADHVFVYLMSSSNDGSREYLQQFPNFVTIIDIDDKNNKSNERNRTIKNNNWKSSIGKADFVIVTDFDEVIYCKDLKKELQYMKENKMTIVKPEIYELITKENILDTNVLDADKFIHNQIQNGFYNPKFGKHCLFDPNNITEIYYGPGVHVCNPKGNIKYYDKKEIFLIHIKYLGLSRYLRNCDIQNNRLSIEDKNNKWGIQYGISKLEKINFFNKMLNYSVKLNNIFNKTSNYISNEQNNVIKSQLSVKNEEIKQKNKNFNNIKLNYILRRFNNK